MSVEWVEVVVRSERNAFPLPLQSFDSWIFVKENPGKKRKCQHSSTYSPHFDPIPHILNIPTQIPGIATQIPCIPTPITCISTPILNISLIPFPNSSFRLLQIVLETSWETLKNSNRRELNCSKYINCCPLHALNWVKSQLCFQIIMLQYLWLSCSKNMLNKWGLFLNTSISFESFLVFPWPHVICFVILLFIYLFYHSILWDYLFIIQS